MSSEVSGRVQQMRDSASQLGQSASRIDEAVNGAMNQVNSLGDDRFSSDAATAFREEFRRLTPQLQEAQRMLVQFQKSLNDSANALEAAAAAR